MKMAAPGRRVAAALTVGLLAGGCGGSGTPSDSTEPVTPSPAPIAAATATPTGTPLPGTSCRLPPVARRSDYCTREATGDFIPQVDAAIHRLMVQEPDLFKGNQIQDLSRYRVGVLRNIEAAGLCAQWGEDREGHREIAVKNTNAYSEQYHIEVSNGTVRTGLGAYRATCSPANFPVNPQPLEQRGDCRLPSSRSYGCDRAGRPQFAGLMDELAAEVARERPHLVRDDHLVGSWDEYHGAIIQKLLARGYCAVFGSTEISVKNSNDFSEQYLMEYSWGQLRHGTDAWRATCRPATF